jgi:predicted nucleotidyltransferase
MKFGLNDTHFKIVDALLFAPLKRNNIKVYVFGSRARGKHHPFSDLDVLYVLPKNINLNLSLISSLKEKLENSNLPIKIDLVSLDDLVDSYKSQVLSEMIEV